MTEEEMRELFEKHEDKYLDFGSIENKRSKRTDLHAFLLLDELIPNQHQDIIAAASHDEIFLDADPEMLAAVITENQIIELVRCGVRCTYEGLCMFA